MSSPWGTLFANCEETDTVNIQAAEGSGAHPPVVMSPLDINAVNISLPISGIIVFAQQLEAKRLIEASKLMAAKYPILAGRFRTDKEMLEIDCTNEGFPLTFAIWPEGCVESFPEILTFKDWTVSAPCRLPAPFFVDELDAFGAVFEGQPFCKLRLTSLGGDNSCILTITMSHVVCGGAEIAILLADLASACRGEHLQPLAKGITRELFTVQGLGEAVPFLKPLLDELVAASEAQGEENKHSFKEEWNRVYGGQEEHNVPVWPQNWGSQTIACVLLQIPRGDLDELKKRASANRGGAQLSTNDILVGLNWVLRCIVEGSPLPGQPGSEADLACTIINVAANSFPGMAEHYFGNTTSGLTFKLGADSDLIASNGKEDDGEAALFGALYLAAVANRNALTQWRSGSEVQRFLERIIAPNRLEKEKQALAAAMQAGACLRSLHSNLLHLLQDKANEGWAKMDCGSGPPKQIFLYSGSVSQYSGIMPDQNSGGALWRAFLPGNFQEKLDASNFMKFLLPNAKILLRE